MVFKPLSGSFQLRTLHCRATLICASFGGLIIYYHFLYFPIKRSWHFTEGGSVIVAVERVSVTNIYPASTVKMKMKICGQWKKEMDDKERKDMKVPK